LNKLEAITVMKLSPVILIEWLGRSCAEKKSHPKLQKPWQQVVKTNTHPIQLGVHVPMSEYNLSYLLQVACRTLKQYEDHAWVGDWA